MSNREVVMGVLDRLPDDAPLQDIVREIELLARIRSARVQARLGEGIPAERAHKLLDEWLGQ